MAGHYLPTRGVPPAAAAAAARLCAPLGSLPKVPAAVLVFSGLVFLRASLGPGLFANKGDHNRVRVSGKDLGGTGVGGGEKRRQWE